MQDARGVSDFEALQVALRSRPSRLIFYAFDLLHLDGKDLLDRPLVERRAKLLELVRHDQESPIQFSEEFIGDAAAFFRACSAHELEGRSARRFRGKAWKLKQVSFGWRVLCTSKTLGFHFCRCELTRFAFSRLPSAYSINSWLT